MKSHHKNINLDLEQKKMNFIKEERKNWMLSPYEEVHYAKCDMRSIIKN
jgi:hypothetical protein